MRPEITGAILASPNTWQVAYDFADISLAMTVLAKEPAEARRIASEQLARYEVKFVLAAK